MKKTTINERLMAVILAVMMMLSIFTGCTAQAKPAEFGGNTEEQAVGTTTQETVSNQETASQKTESSDELEGLKAELEAALEAFEAVLAENDALKAENEELRLQVVPAVEVIDGAVYCDVDYFLSRATVTFEDGTAALWAIEEGTEVVLDDIHAITERGNHREKTIPLPISGGNVAVTLDGEKATSVALHTHKSEWALCYAEELETGYELRNAKRDGVEAEWLKITAVCVENAEAEYGYDFYVVINMECVPEVVYTPVYTPQQPKPEEPKEEPKVEEPEVQEPIEEPEKPCRPNRPSKPEEPENNPPIEDDPETPDEPNEPIPGVPENNPPIEDTPFPEGPQPPADMDPENSPPADMQDSTKGPADFGVSAPSTSVGESSAPADMGGSTSNSSSSSRSSGGSSNRASSTPDSSGPADMA